MAVGFGIVFGYPRDRFPSTDKHCTVIFCTHPVSVSGARGERGDTAVSQARPCVYFHPRRRGERLPDAVRQASPTATGADSWAVDRAAAGRAAEIAVAAGGVCAFLLSLVQRVVIPLGLADLDDRWCGSHLWAYYYDGRL